MHILLILKSLVRHPLLALKTFFNISRDKTDLVRWQQIDNLKKDWDSRTILIAGLIPPESSVLEFGAGRLVLRNHLPPGCTYLPSDVVDRGAGTIVCDLNRSFPSLSQRFTHAVFSGVLEYLSDIGLVVNFLKNHADTIIASYSSVNKLSDYITRRRHGWINHLTEDQLISLFESRGFELQSMYPWKLQTIFVFKNVISRS